MSRRQPPRIARALRRAATAGVFVAALAATLALSQPAAARFDASDLLVILVDTGQVRDGLPVLAPHPDPQPIRDVLLRGFSGTLLEIYRLEQTFLARRDGSKVEPAYLVLTDNQGGFPRTGFYLGDTAKRGAGFVDLHKQSTLAGRFGAMDQIFPHELLHVIVQQLTGDAPEGRANQIHAIGVRTDPVTAFSEGFAEHAQIMAIDDPDAVMATRMLATDERLRKDAFADFDRYGAELRARLAPVAPMRMRFPFWFSQDEQALRYHAVKANLYEREPRVPDRLLTSPLSYDAYLMANVLPGDADGPTKPPRVALSSEGVVSHLFWRWATDAALQHRDREPAFYEPFGTSRAAITPLENLYLKLFYALSLHKPHDAAGVLAAYRQTFPDEVPFVDAVETESLAGRRFEPAPEIWLANTAFETGTSLFDQFRSAPRPHAFDVNAATTIDWLSVPGVSRPLAAALVAHAPYAAIDDVRRAPGVDAALLARIKDMAAEMERLHARSADLETSLSIGALLRPYWERALVVWLLASTAATVVYRRVRHVRWWRATAAAVIASFLVLGTTWILILPSWLPPWFVPALLVGVPAAVWQLARRRGWRTAGLRLLSWLVAGAPAAIATQAWF